ncbi:protein of unassigned function [Methylobacterium oryzae CBMB20]|uniref:Protein of unassigned function n=1 Tax=Methylobacterium oryzae CBMB20 TaxID=693986 RepID=A0A089NUL0_9HYPH|nr:protein of unassigned function [Methylobacterium oryzae CBMB20]
MAAQPSDPSVGASPAARLACAPDSRDAPQDAHHDKRTLQVLCLLPSQLNGRTKLDVRSARLENVQT